MKTLTTESTREEILEAFSSVDLNNIEIEDEVYLDDEDATAVKYTHCEGYFYKLGNGQEWFTIDPYDFETDEEERITLNHKVWLKG